MNIDEKLIRSIFQRRMPYHIVSVPGGFKVCKKQPGRRKYYSDKPLTKEMAMKQMRALYRSEKSKD
jgi:hypothetical protein